MPGIEYQCDTCGHRFERLVLRGDPIKGFPCPECGEKNERKVRPAPAAESLFEGIASFSDLAGDTN